MRKLRPLVLVLKNMEWRKMWILALSDHKLRQQSTFLGFLWTLLHPALMFAAIYFLFIKWLGKYQENYAIYLLTGLVQWNYFAGAASAGLSSLSKKSELLKNYRINPETAVLASNISAAIPHIMELLLLILLIAFFAGNPRPGTLIFLFPLEILFFLLIAGISFFLSKLNLIYADMERIWAIILSAGFFLTPVFYPLSILNPKVAAIVMLNPLARMIEMTRGVMLGNSIPLQSYLGATTLFCILVFSAGFASMKTGRNSVMDNI